MPHALHRPPAATRAQGRETPPQKPGHHEQPLRIRPLPSHTGLVQIRRYLARTEKFPAPRRRHAQPSAPPRRRPKPHTLSREAPRYFDSVQTYIMHFDSREACLRAGTPRRILVITGPGTVCRSLSRLPVPVPLRSPSPPSWLRPSQILWRNPSPPAWQQFWPRSSQNLLQHP